jgi:hypothetical protein
MVREFTRLDKRRKEYQKLYFDENYQVYITYEDEKETIIKNIFVEHDTYKSKDGCDSISFFQNGYYIGRTDKYLFFNSDEKIPIPFLDDFLNNIIEMPNELIVFIKKSLENGLIKK